MPSQKQKKSTAKISQKAGKLPGYRVGSTAAAKDSSADGDPRRSKRLQGAALEDSIVQKEIPKAPRKTPKAVPRAAPQELKSAKRARLLKELQELSDSSESSERSEKCIFCR